MIVDWWQNETENRILKYVQVQAVAKSYKEHGFKLMMAKVQHLVYWCFSSSNVKPHRVITLWMYHHMGMWGKCGTITSARLMYNYTELTLFEATSVRQMLNSMC